MARKAAAKTEEKPAATEKPKYGVPELADALGIEPTSVRVKLRNSGIEKSGRSYGWNTKKDFDAVVKQMKAGAKAEEAEEKPKPKRSRKKATADA